MPPPTKEDIVALLVLQEKDAALDKLGSEIELIPKEIASLRDALEGEKTAWNAAKAHIVELEKGKKSCELDLASKEEAARKHGMELNQVKTNEAFKALQSQIDKAKQEGSDLETKILEHMDALDTARHEEKQQAAHFKITEEKAKTVITAREAELTKLQAEFAAAKAARDEAAAPLPAEMMKVYNHIRSRGKKDAVAPIKDGLCGGCRIALPPQSVVEATKGNKLVVCESCNRIVYAREGSAFGLSYKEVKEASK